jgi:DNA-binding phage protein
MLPTYRATLRGDRLEREDDIPEQARDEEPVTVYVTIVRSQGDADTSRGRRMANALELLAASGGVTSIADPAQWQREQREDREIRGRP